MSKITQKQIDYLMSRCAGIIASRLREFDDLYPTSHKLTNDEIKSKLEAKGFEVKPQYNLASIVSLPKSKAMLANEIKRADLKDKLEAARQQIQDKLMLEGISDITELLKQMEEI